MDRVRPTGPRGPKRRKKLPHTPKPGKKTRVYADEKISLEAAKWLKHCGLSVIADKEVYVNPKVDLFAENLDYNMYDYYVLCSKIDRSNQYYSEARMFDRVYKYLLMRGKEEEYQYIPLGILAIIGFPIFYFTWNSASPQIYESGILRLLAGILVIPLIQKVMRVLV